MATLTNGEAWTGNITQSTKSKAYNFATSGRYVDKNINITITAADAGAVSATNLDISASDTTSGASIKNESAGWVGTNSTYVTGVTLNNGKEFDIHADTIDWTISKDGSGNIIVK